MKRLTNKNIIFGLFYRKNCHIMLISWQCCFEYCILKHDLYCEANKEFFLYRLSSVSWWHQYWFSALCMTFIISSTSFYVPPMHFGCNERPSKVKPSTYSSWKIWKIISKCVYKQISINFKKVTILYHCALCDASTVMHKCNTHHSTKNSKEKTVHNLQNLQPTNFPLNWDISVVKYAFLSRFRKR